MESGSSLTSLSTSFDTISNRLNLLLVDIVFGSSLILLSAVPGDLVLNNGLNLLLVDLGWGVFFLDFSSKTCLVFTLL